MPSIWNDFAGEVGVNKATLKKDLKPELGELSGFSKGRKAGANTYEQSQEYAESTVKNMSGSAKKRAAKQKKAAALAASGTTTPASSSEATAVKVASAEAKPAAQKPKCSEKDEVPTDWWTFEDA